MTPAEEIEQLREAVAWLTSQLAEARNEPSHVALKRVLGLPGQAAKLLCVMLARPGKTVTFASFEDLVLADEHGDVHQETTRNIVRVQLCRVKAGLKALGAPDGIRSVWGAGYYVTPELAAWVEARL